LYDSLTSSYFHRFSIKRESGGIYTYIGGMFSPPIEDDTCLYDYYGEFEDTLHRYRLYDNNIYNHSCGYVRTDFVLVNNNDYYFSASPWYDTTRLKEQFDSCTDSPIS